MPNFHTHGTTPFRIAVIHGGPGAAGEMFPVARALSPSFGILEPYQTATTLDGQVSELIDTIQQHAQPPVTLIGHSWGAWLSFIVAAHAPRLINKLILIASGPFEDRYAIQIQATRLARLATPERLEYESILESLSAPNPPQSALARLAALCRKTDTYDPLADSAIGPMSPIGPILPSSTIFQSVWAAAAELRRSGQLLALASQIRCPVVAIHGDHDPHPAEGVSQPLASRLADFRFILLKNCGHTPWLERRARESFFAILNELLKS
ncbi:alpha/beta hydrolase [bacterium]|nr:alpha/beta hydrolase [bacterium]